MPGSSAGGSSDLPGSTGAGGQGGELAEVAGGAAGASTRAESSQDSGIDVGSLSKRKTQPRSRLVSQIPSRLPASPCTWREIRR